jgi:hypothetical protein
MSIGHAIPYREWVLRRDLSEQGCRLTINAGPLGRDPVSQQFEIPPGVFVVTNGEAYIDAEYVIGIVQGGGFATHFALWHIASGGMIAAGELEQAADVLDGMVLIATPGALRVQIMTREELLRG